MSAVIDDDVCRCAVCDRTFEDDGDFDRHRSRGGFLDSGTPRPPTERISRNLIEDCGLIDGASAKSGGRAQHVEAAVSA
ncbi:hypothetical protein [Mycobacterium sp. 852002-51152_SCH6134967]|uniref:hypothetical protein n=1 Tax=Mycobacterium sp. 852002-51152_SCH6134967 TaxID=1834096 RepID=UPI000ABEA214|nr:hypothetical protein [Mycobacterium sp. 852002-51152_SCH6134967]